MSKSILMAWELGSEIGHLSLFAELTRIFQARGYKVVIAARDLSRTHFFFRKLDVPVIQAPVWLYPVKMDRPVYCMADILLTKGYLFPTTLQNLVEAWQSMLTMIQPDLVISEYAPTLRMALRGPAIPDVVLGSGFAEPVPGLAMRDLRPVPHQDGVVSAQEARLLETMNQVLSDMGKPQLSCFGDLYKPNLTVLKTLPELDCYKRVESTRYCLPVSRSKRPAAQWSQQPGKAKVFVYALPEHPQWQVLVDALRRCHANVYLYSPGDRRKRLKPIDEDSFRLGIDVVNVYESLQQADLFVCHGEMHNLIQAISLGVPALVFPMNLEQLLNGLRYQRLGAGVCQQKVADSKAGSALIDQILVDDKLKNNAAQLKVKADGYAQQDAMEQVAEYCVDLLQ